MADEQTKSKTTQIDIPRFRSDAVYRRQIMEATQAEIEAERAARDILPMRRQRMAVKESVGRVWRDAFETAFYSAPVPVFSSAFRQLVKGRVTGQLREWHWVLPRRHPWLGPVFEKTGIDRLAMRL